MDKEADGSPTEFSIHEEAIAQLSKPLFSLVKGGLKESQAGYTVWEDVSKETFEQSVQFAYTGDYSVPKLEKRGSSADRDKTASKVFCDEPQEKNHQVCQPGEEIPPSTVDEFSFEWSPLFKKKDKKAKKMVNRVEETPPSPEDFRSVPLPFGPFGFLQHPSALPKPSKEFKSLRYPLLTPRNNYAGTYKPSEFCDPEASYSNQFLTHTILYILGDFE